MSQNAMSGVTIAGEYNGRDLRGMFAVATSCLERNADAINAINVFPVADSDTGTNMYLTMRAAMEDAFHTKTNAAGTVARAIAHGALMGGYGKSGGILSQILTGIADGLSERDSFSASDFARALEAASTRAYKAVREPVEGTILTVTRESAAAARRGARKRGSTVESLLADAVEAARKAVSKTPSLLPVLREAGVVDAGAQGLYVMLEGALRYLRRDSAPPLALAGHDPEASWLAATASLHEETESYYSYCTEFLLKGDNLDSGAVLERMLALGDSVLVAADGALLRVHVHTNDPEAALGFGASLGSVSSIRIDDIQAETEESARLSLSGFGTGLTPPQM